jgi:hypothetical protein
MVGLLAIVAVVVVCSGPRAAAAADFQPSFPRVAIWWPDARSESTTGLAKCDWIALQDSDAGYIAALRAKNPSIMVLGTTSACEMSYSLAGYKAPANAELNSVSTDWILTQVGSTLSADIDAAATSIPVDKVADFAAGEMVLVDHELMHVDRIDGSRLIVSTRGPVTPPTSHVAGTRIAAVVVHWSSTIVFDLSGNCPARDVGDGYGPETWSQWNVRRGLAVLGSADWDGLLIDALQSNPSWMVDKGDVRSIDPTRSNVAVTDGYAGFNAAWDTGAITYGNALRAAVGSKVLVGNGNLRNYRLNGNIFEEYPYLGLPASVWNVVFRGPFAYPHASYPEWCTEAATPVATLVQVYGASTNYRLMRYGLGSALMSDGYFSYALSSTYHAAKELDWFDEYDGGGIGRGYLGVPTAGATKVGNAWRRDFAGGVALVNPSSRAVTVKLGGSFRKIRGAQDRKLNSGATVSSVKIAAQDGLVLLRIPKMALSAASTVVTIGRETTLQVTVSRLPVGSVRFDQRTAGTKTWRRVTSVTFDDQRVARLTRAPSATTEYRAVLPALGVVTKMVKVSVRPAITIAASSLSVRASSRVTISGTVRGSGRTAVVLQRLSGGVWRTVRKLRSSSGRYSTSVFLPSRGTFSYRVHVGTATTHLAASSVPVRISVR